MKPTAHEEVAAAVCGVPAKVTAVTEVAAEVTVTVGWGLMLVRVPIDVCRDWVRN